jgi:NDP-sugar pyrophosphorylase family protein
MVLAAGRGERMEPLSSTIPKPALDVLGTPLLASALFHLRGVGCNPVVVNLHRHPELVVAAARSARGGPLRFSWEPCLLGSLGGLAAAGAMFGAGPVMVANGDVWSDLDLSPLVAAQRSDSIVLGLVEHPDPTRWSSVVLDRDARVASIVAAGETGGRSGYLFTGFQLIGEEVVASLPPPPGRMATLWQTQRARGTLRGIVLEGSWREAGTPEAYRRLVEALLAGRSWCHDDAKVAASAAIGASAVGAGCRIGGGVRLDGCVVTGGAAVARGARLRRCVVAGAVRVAAHEAHEDALLMAHGTFPLR